MTLQRDTKSIVQELLLVLDEFNKQDIEYVVLRNYEHLLSEKEILFEENDLDITISKKDIKKAEEILLSFKFIKSSPNFSRVHQGYLKYVHKAKSLAKFDIQNDGIYWNDNVYLENKEIIPRRKFNGSFYVLSNEDQLIHYLCHSILGKRKFKKKYQTALFKLSKEECNWDFIRKKLSFIFNQKTAKWLIESVKKNDIQHISKEAKSLAFRYQFKNWKHTKISICLFFRWFFSQKYCPLRKIPLLRYFLKNSPMISIIGPDGSGKSTMTQTLYEVLKNSGWKVDLIYAGRGKKNIIPIKKVGNIYKKKEKKEKVKKSTKRILYTLSAPIYTRDLLIRYYTQIVPKRKQKHIVITDRYCSDILLMK